MDRGFPMRCASLAARIARPPGQDGEDRPRGVRRSSGIRSAVAYHAQRAIVSGEPSEHQTGEGAAGDSEVRLVDEEPTNAPDIGDSASTEQSTSSAIPPGHRAFWNRLLGTLRCEAGVFEEIAEDPGATRQALLVVVVALLAATAGRAAVSDWNSWQALPMLLLFAISTFAAWPIGAAICSVMSRWFSVDSPRFSFWLRAVGFIQAPLVLGVIPIAGSLVAWAYCLVLQVVAVKRLGRVSTGIAIIVGLVAFFGPGLFAGLVSAFVISMMALAKGVLSVPL